MIDDTTVHDMTAGIGHLPWLPKVIPGAFGWVASLRVIFFTSRQLQPLVLSRANRVPSILTAAGAVQVVNREKEVYQPM
jgi:hypothetical protein